MEFSKKLLKLFDQSKGKISCIDDTHGNKIVIGFGNNGDLSEFEHNAISEGFKKFPLPKNRAHFSAPFEIKYVCIGN